MSKPFASDDFDRLFDGNDDPWRFRSLWYEKRKRDLTLACLPRRHYGSIYEPGCANGELSAALATRCDRLLATDGSARAVGLARTRLAGIAGAEVREAWLPQQWPDERFDLIVVSELGYFLAPALLDELIERVRTSLRPEGTVLACHWRHPIEHGEVDGDAVHAHLQERLRLPSLGRWIETDFRIDVWGSEARTPAQRDGLA